MANRADGCRARASRIRQTKAVLKILDTIMKNRYLRTIKQVRSKENPKWTKNKQNSTAR